MTTAAKALREFPQAQVVRYFNGDVQIIVPAARPQWGEVVRYSDGGAQTTINLYS